MVVENVNPEIDGGRFPVKRVIGDRLAVEADVFADAHDEVSACILYRHETESQWQPAPMQRIAGDRWRGEFPVARLGCYRYSVEGWIEHFETWRRDLLRRIAASQDLAVEFQIGAALIEEAAAAAEGADAASLRSWAARLGSEPDPQIREGIATVEALATLVRRYSPRRFAGRYPRELSVVVESSQGPLFHLVRNFSPLLFP